MKKTATTKEATPATRPSAKPWSVNRVQLVGRLAADPTVRDTTAGPVASLRVATNSTRVAEFHDVVVWGKDATESLQGFTKGNAVTIEGRLRTRTWTAADGYAEGVHAGMIAHRAPLTQRDRRGRPGVDP